MSKVRKFKWEYLLIIAFITGITIPFLLRLYDRYQLVKIAKQFAYAVQTKDFQEATQLVLPTERKKLGVTIKVLEKAFGTLELSQMYLTGAKVTRIVRTGGPVVADILSSWQLPNGQKVSVILEMMKEEGKWWVNFFFTFRRFYALKLRLQGWDKVKAFQESKPRVIQVLRSIGMRGYVSDFGTIRSFEGKAEGILTP